MAFTVTYPGQSEGAGDARALYLKLFSGEVLTAFARKNMAMGMVKTRTISGGKSSQFIVTGKFDEANVVAHTPGTDISTNILKANERVITITDRYYHSVFLDDLEMKLAQYDIRSEIAKQMAEVISTKIDKSIFQGVYATASLTPIAGQQAGSVITNTAIASATSSEAKGDELIESIFAAQSALDAKDVPMEGRQFVTTPANYYAIVQSSKGVNRDWTQGNGGIDTGKVMTIAGLTITWSNNLPTAAGFEGMIFTPDCYGVVKAMDITSEANYIPEKLGDLLTSYYAIGQGGLDPTPIALIMSA